MKFINNEVKNYRLKFKSLNEIIIVYKVYRRRLGFDIEVVRLLEYRVEWFFLFYINICNFIFVFSVFFLIFEYIL